MIDPSIRQKYTVTIGTECHVQLATKTKLFSGASNDDSDQPPNTVVSPICFGLPGTLPVLNQKAVELAVRAGLALNAKVNLISKFDRKHYFYPDLPKGYQITQLYEPIVGAGEIEISLDGETKKVGITRAHLEEDAGKSSHSGSATLVDLNRAGTPLLEIVSEPDMHSAAEAKAYARELYLRMKYAGVSNVDLYRGNMRFDVNVSVSADTKKLGVRSETKNLNSFRSVEKAVLFEVDRQIELLEKGLSVVQETRGWDDAKQKTFSQRSKEDAHDYRYMPEPDVPPIVLDKKNVAQIVANMPPSPVQIRDKLSALDLDQAQIETLVEEPDVAAFVSGLNEAGITRIIANWLTGEIARAVSDNEYSWAEAIGHPDGLIQLAKMYEGKKLSSTAAKELLPDVVAGQDPGKTAQFKNLLQVSDEAEIEKIVAEVLSENVKAAEDVKNGELKAIGFLVGQVMAKSKGQANPALAQQLIKKQLGV